MRIVSEAMEEKWRSAAKIGANSRPTGRVTIQYLDRSRIQYATRFGMERGNRMSRGSFNSYWFGNARASVELPNVRTISWARSTDQDVAECTITMANIHATPMGTAQIEELTFDQPGYYSPRRGRHWAGEDRWGYSDRPGWAGRLRPDAIVRTYEGYGMNPTVEPAYDTNLEQTGVWFIDDIDFTTDGQITIKCRDAGRLLMDAIVMPTMIPATDYPITWEKVHTIDAVGRTATGGSWRLPVGKARSSNEKYVDAGFVKRNLVVQGHRAQEPILKGHPDAVGGEPGDPAPTPSTPPKFWCSLNLSSRTSKAWWQIDLAKPTAIAGLRIAPKWGPYMVWVSLKTKDGWLGKRKIPYRKSTTRDVDINADIPFVQKFAVDEINQADWILRKKYKGVTAIRLTFGSLPELGEGKHPYRAGLKSFKIYTGNYDKLKFQQGTYQKVVGNHRDLTDIVKWLGAWAGFYWPPAGSKHSWIRFSSGAAQSLTPFSEDNVLMRGRVWGDFQDTATTLESPILPDAFDKQPFMDVISHLREITGFSFWVDETGAMVWRMPNIWQLGNYVTPHHLDRRPDRLVHNHASDILTIDEEQVLLDYRVTMSSRNLRERIFVGDGSNKRGIAIAGFSSGTGLRRTAGWTDGNWKTLAECVVAADMIAQKQMMTFRRGSVTIPGYPAIQIDDQVRIYERVTSETFVHYVNGISSSLNNETGEYTYELDTSWLGGLDEFNNPDEEWVADPTKLSEITKILLRENGSIA